MTDQPPIDLQARRNERQMRAADSSWGECIALVEALDHELNALRLQVTQLETQVDRQKRIALDAIALLETPTPLVKMAIEDLRRIGW